ncbi:MAG: MFS transporter [Candidatus Lokiarchaeota archaeon]|nr:MFS transporter [Candidatus Lokiarchaeota archaeon]
MENLNEVSIPRKTFKQFLWLWATQYISLIGSQLVSFSVTWFLTIETGSSLILSLSTISNMVPMILVSPFAGVIADRRSKNKILFISDAVQAFATFVLIMLFFFGIFEIWQILVLMGIRGICQGFQMPVAVSLNSLMVPKKFIQKINAFDRVFMALLSIVTPIAGAFLIQIMPINQIYWFDVITCVPTLIVLLIVKIPRVATQGTGKLHFLEDFKISVRYMHETKLIPPFILFGLANFFVVPLFSLLPLLLQNYHGGLEREFGFLMASVQVGFFIGGLILMLIKKQPKMKGVVIWAFINSFVLLALAAIPNTVSWNFWAIYVVGFVLGLCITFIDTQLITILQIVIPREYQGRIFSSLFTLIKSIMPLGLIIWGALAEFTGIWFQFILTPILSIISFIILGLSTPIFKFDEIHTTQPPSEKTPPASSENL